MKGYISTICRLPFAFSLAAALIISCGGGSSSSNSDDESAGKNRVFSNLPIFNYSNGLTKAEDISEEDLVKEYSDWKAHYVVEGDVGLRVKRDASSYYDTVSEGMGYGMLLAVLFNDQTTFDKMYAYVRAHYVSSTIPLMHWKVSADGVNISEFRIPVPHPKAYMLKSDWTKRDEERTYIAPETDPGSNYVLASIYDRKLGSATDADLDIAMALVMASRKWMNTTYSGSAAPGYDYRIEAAKTIKAVIQTDCAKGTFVTNGSLWGSNECWNPCYFAPAWFRAFKEFINDQAKNTAVTAILPATWTTKCDDIINNMYAEMKIIDASNGTAGLFPDWCKTTNGILEKSIKSDRIYMLDENGDGIPDTNPDWIDANGNGTDDNTGLPNNQTWLKMSFNYYYDAVRVPFRIGMDYAWYGDTVNAKPILLKMANFFKGKEASIVDGYAIDGTAWKREDCDGFNNIPSYEFNADGSIKKVSYSNGGSGPSTTFFAMNACASLALDDDTSAKTFIGLIKNNKEKYFNTDASGKRTASMYNYYGNTVRILSMLFMSGKFSAPERTVAIKSVRFNTYMTRDSEGMFRDWDQATGVDKTTPTANSTYKIINLGGNDIAIMNVATGGFLRRSKTTLTDNADPKSIFGLNKIGDTISTTTIDIHGLNPEAVWTVVDLGDGQVAFLHKKTQNYLRGSEPYMGAGYPARIDSNNGVLDENGNVRSEIAFKIETL